MFLPLFSSEKKNKAILKTYFLSSSIFIFPFFLCDVCNFEFRVPFQGLRSRNRTTFGLEAQPWNRLASLASVPEQSVVGHSLAAGEP